MKTDLQSHFEKHTSSLSNEFTSHTRNIEGSPINLTRLDIGQTRIIKSYKVAILWNKYLQSPREGIWDSFLDWSWSLFVIHFIFHGQIQLDTSFYLVERTLLISILLVSNCSKGLGSIFHWPIQRFRCLSIRQGWNKNWRGWQRMTFDPNGIYRTALDPVIEN